jgi:hypothetical protein
VSTNDNTRIWGVMIFPFWKQPHGSGSTTTNLGRLLGAPLHRVNQRRGLSLISERNRREAGSPGVFARTGENLAYQNLGHPPAQFYAGAGDPQPIMGPKRNKRVNRLAICRTELVR